MSSVFLLFPSEAGLCIGSEPGVSRHLHSPRAGRAPTCVAGSYALRDYVMHAVALEQERLFIAERLLSEIERRHGLPHPKQRDLHPIIVDRFLTVYLPAAMEGEPAPCALEYACTPTMMDALDVLRGAVEDAPNGYGAAIYVYDLDTGVTAGRDF